MEMADEEVGKYLEERLCVDSEDGGTKELSSSSFASASARMFRILRIN